jgi:multidrug resistance efflux pump
MKTINRLQPSLPTPVSDRRTTSGSLVRFLYATALIIIIGYFVYFFGHYLIFFEGPAVVYADVKALSLPFTMQIKKIYIEPGTQISKGDEVALVYSPEVTIEISRLLTSIATLEVQREELKTKADVSDASIYYAEIRNSAAINAENKVMLSRPNSLNTSFKLEVVREASLANQNAKNLKIEKERAIIEISTIDKLLNALKMQLTQAREDYQDGKVFSSMSGVVGARVAHAGETLIPGQNIAEVYDRTDFYLRWLMPYTKWHQAGVNDKVYIVFGNNYLSGYVSDVSPVSDLMENKRTSILREPEQGQLVKIKLANKKIALPVGAQVTVRMTYFNSIDRIYGFFSSVMKSDYNHY